jgi:hypothetical protein
MYLMYVDESGDVGLVNSRTRFFILVGLVLHELRWQQTLEELQAFRRQLKADYGLKLREEIHASQLITRPAELARIKKHQRMEILRRYADKLASMPDLSVISVVVDKEGKSPDYDVFECAWQALIQRFENTLAHRNFAGPRNPDDTGMIFPDNSDKKKLDALLRKMRAFNPVPNQRDEGYRNMMVRNVIEDPNYRDSAMSYFVQSVDVVAYLLYQQEQPSAYFKKMAGKNYFSRLDAILCKVAAPRDPQGIVRL